MKDKVIVGQAVRPMAGEQVSGDAVWVHATEDRTTVAVIDGLGHGARAAEAAATAMAFLESLAESSPGLLRDPPELLRRLHSAMRATRGAAVTTCTVDPSRIAVAGVGNVLCATDIEGFSPFPREGIVGYRTIDPIPFHIPRVVGRLILHTDGLGDFELAETAELSCADAARHLLTHHARDEDDAGVAVIRVV